MVSYECRTCGGTMQVISKGMGKCMWCNRVDSMPTIDSEKFNRAERLRREQQSFDEAADLYRQIIADNPDEEEAYWGLVLCKFGIEYVEDVDKKMIPTCHRTIETSILDDTDYILACQKASDEKRHHYEEQAGIIQKIQSEILDIVSREKLYDVFISYKSKDTSGNPTLESFAGSKIYNKLDKMGYRTFFAEETLETGKAYEPQIYAALKTSKIMILVGNRKENLESRWVKNEWRRYKHMMEAGERKLIIPVCIDMDPYELPMEIKNTQAVVWKDPEAMSKLITAVEDFIDEKPVTPGNIGYEDINEVIKKRDADKISKKMANARGYLENRSLDECKDLLDDIIKDDPDNAEAYWMRLCVKLEKSYNVNSITEAEGTITTEPDYKMALHYADSEQKRKYEKIERYLSKKFAYKSSVRKRYNICTRFTDEAGQAIMQKKADTEKKLAELNSYNRKADVNTVGLFLGMIIIGVILFAMGTLMAALNEGAVVFLIAMLYIALAPMISYMMAIKSEGGELSGGRVFLGIVLFPVTLIICISRIIRSASRLNARKKIMGVYYGLYGELCLLLDNNAKKAIDEGNKLYSEYACKEPSDIELKPDNTLLSLETAYSQYRSSVYNEAVIAEYEKNNGITH